jgi:hypothetical protein
MFTANPPGAPAETFPMVPDLPDSQKKKHVVDPFPMLGPGREYRMKFCFIGSGEAYPQDMIDIMSTPDKYVVLERKSETIVVGDKVVCAVTLWYVVGGLVPDTRTTAPIDPEKPDEKPTTDPLEDALAPLPEIDLMALLSKGTVGVASFDRANPAPRVEISESTAPMDTQPAESAAEASATPADDSKPTTALDELSSKL